MEPNISVVIPWRPRESRIYAFDIVREWYETNLPEAKILIVDDKREPFCLSGTRNLGVSKAEEDGADIVILNDADTVPEISALRFAIYKATRDDRVVLPYNEYHSLRDIGTNQFVKGTPISECNSIVIKGACSGVYVFQPKVWWSHYGQDERFRGWGFEDAAWFAAHTTIIGREPRRVAGKVFAFTHKSEIKSGPDYERNAQLCYHYLQAQGNIEKMKEISSQGLFLDDRVV